MTTPGPEDWDRWMDDEDYDYASWSNDQTRHLSTVDLFQGHAGARFVPYAGPLPGLTVGPGRAAWPAPAMRNDGRALAHAGQAGGML
jgi:hypothetical protein